MNKGRRSIDPVNSFGVGIYIGKKENETTYMSPDVAIKEGFKFSMNREDTLNSERRCLLRQG